MSAGTIATASIPNWPQPPAGLLEAIEVALGNGGFAFMRPDGLYVSDTATANGVLSGYVGGAAQLAYAKSVKQAALDAALATQVDLKGFVQGTEPSFAAHIDRVAAAYRPARDAIAAAVKIDEVHAVDIGAVAVVDQASNP